MKGAPTVVKDVSLVDVAEQPQTSQAMAPTQPQTGADLVLMFERLAKDKDVDVEKLQRLIDMQKEILRHQAEAEFWEAFSRMQGDLPTINEDGAIVVDDGSVRSRYSTNENIQEVIRPILQRHGFALSFRNQTTDDGKVKVIGILAGYGHKETDEFISKPDDGGKMNSIQRIGSTRSYGARYTTIALLNIVSRAKADRDDDGSKSEATPAPTGYDAWQLDMEACAAEGWPKLAGAFSKSKDEYRKRATGEDKRWWNSLKVKAEGAQR